MQLPKRVARRRALRSDLVALDFDLDGKLRGSDSVGNAVDIFPVPPASVPLSQKGAANGVAPLGADQKIASIYLPGSVDDIQPYPNLASLPAVGEVAIIYVAVNDGLLHPSNPTKEYRWNGSGYTEMVKSPGTTDALVEGVVNQYFTVARAIAALTPTLASYLTITAANTALSANSTADRNRENHTGQQAASTIAGFNAAVLTALETSNAAMGVTLLADLPATPPAGTADQVVSVQKSSTDKRRIILVSDNSEWQFLNGKAVIDKSLDESTDMALSGTFGTFSTGTIVLPGKLIRARREFELEFDACFSAANAANQVQVTADGVSIYAPPAILMRKTGHVCRFFVTADGAGYRVAAHLSGFGYGNNSGSGFVSVTTYTPGANITLAIAALGASTDTCRLWRWRLTGHS